MGFDISQLDFGISDGYALEDKKSKFIQFIQNGATDTDFSWMALTFGSTGTGKTAWAFILFCIILKYDNRWTVGFWKPPEGFVNVVKKHCPKNIADKFFAYYKLREIPNWTILLVDEGAVSFNAKEALKKDAVKFEKFLALTRQRHMIVLMNSQVANVMRVYRRMAQFRFYKQMTYEDLRESKDDEFIMDFGYEISRLEQKKVIFTTNYRKFNEEGYMIFDLKKYCSWYCDEISKSYEKTSADLDFDETIKMNPIIHEIAEIVVAALGHMLIDSKGDKLLSSWLRNNRPDIFTDYKVMIPTIYTECVLMLKTDPRFGEEENAPNIVAEDTSENPEDVPLAHAADNITATEIDYKAIKDENEDVQHSFSQYCYSRLVNKDKRVAIMTKMFLDGYGQLDIGEKLGCSEGLVNKLWQETREKIIGYLFESWVSIQLGGDGTTAKNSDLPDFVDENGNIFTIKWRCERKRSCTFSQSEDFAPEYDEVRRRAKDIYYLVLLNLHWKGDNQIKIIAINWHDDDKVLIHRNAATLTFSSFRRKNGKYEKISAMVN